MNRLTMITLAVVAPVLAQAQSRIASDFEIARMQQQLSGSREFLAQLSGHMNLGDAYTTRSELSAARTRYETALNLASRQRVVTRRQSDLTGYSTATSYAALAQAKLGRGAEAFALLEESMRYSSDSAKSWNLYSSAMNALGRPKKASGAARNAVTIATREVETNPSTGNQLDLAIYQHTLATALIDSGEPADAERLLRSLLANLQSPAFDGLRRQVEKSESFETYSTARGETSAYVSLVNRANLRLAALLESRGDRSGAKAGYERVLVSRSDDPSALSALARLSTDKERDRFFIAAFDANPFSLPLIREYQRHLAGSAPSDIDTRTTGGSVRQALEHSARGRRRAAQTALDTLLLQFPGNETLALLRAETESTGRIPQFLENPRSERPLEPAAAELQQLLDARDRLAPEHRAALDSTLFTSTVSFATADAREGKTALLRGTIGEVPFRFSEPTEFHGQWAAATPLRLIYRILGFSELDGKAALLLEPLGLEPAR